jgi:hypothetical protein
MTWGERWRRRRQAALLRRRAKALGSLGLEIWRETRHMESDAKIAAVALFRQVESEAVEAWRKVAETETKETK